MASLKIRFRELLAEKAAKQGEKRITLQQVEDETKLAYNTLSKWSRGHVDRIDVPTLITLCEYFDVEPGDLIKLVE